MTNYTFAFGSAKKNAPEDRRKTWERRRSRESKRENEAKPPLGGFNLAVSSYSTHQQMAFEAAACLAG